MIKHLFTVFDSAANHYLDPFNAPTIEFAIREFKRIVNQEGHQFNQFPEDYTLFHIGTFNAETADINNINATSLGVAITFMEQIQIPFGDQEGVEKFRAANKEVKNA